MRAFEGYMIIVIVPQDCTKRSFVFHVRLGKSQIPTAFPRNQMLRTVNMKRAKILYAYITIGILKPHFGHLSTLSLILVVRKPNLSINSSPQFGQ